MKKASPETLLLTHYRNIQRLSRKQLEVILKDDAAGISESIAQKQMVIEHIQRMQSELQKTSFSDDIRTELQHLLTDIIAVEAQSQDILNRRQEALRHQMISTQQKRMLQAYENTFAAGHAVVKRPR